MPALKWTEAAVREEAKKYNNLREFYLNNSGAYQKAYRLGIINDLGLVGKRVWTEADLFVVASNYLSRVEFEKGNNSAYQAMCRRKNGAALLDQMFGEKVSWSEELIREVASKYTTKQEFRRGNPKARDAAMRLGIMDDLGFIPGDTSDNDAIYIWRAVGCVFNGNPVFKIGVTSQRLGTIRIEQVARAAGLEYELICCEPVLGRATLVEAKLHMLGEDPEMRGFDGATEFRALNKSALDAALSIIKANQ